MPIHYDELFLSILNVKGTCDTENINNKLCC